jgi:hypothetical protein
MNAVSDRMIDGTQVSGRPGVSAPLAAWFAHSGKDLPGQVSARGHGSKPPNLVGYRHLKCDLLRGVAMTKVFILASLTLALSLPLQARDDIFAPQAGFTAVWFKSVSERRSYGLLIAAPDSGCRHVRFRVEGRGQAFLGHTPPLEPGQLAVVRLGMGFPAGENELTIASVGCDVHPAATRRVVFAKIGPDHGWRATQD